MADEKLSGSADVGGTEAILQEEDGGTGEDLVKKYGDLSCSRFFLEWKHCMCELFGLPKPIWSHLYVSYSFIISISSILRLW